MFNQLKSFLSRTFSKGSASRPQAPESSDQSAQALNHPAQAASQPAAANPVQSAPAAQAAAPFTPPEPLSPDDIFQLPVKVVVGKLGPELAALVKTPGNGNISLSLKRILAQLPLGVVRLPFGEIRYGAPAGTFLDVASQDQTIVELPLPEILARLSPQHLARRPAQKTIEVPPEVGDVFGPRGEQIQKSSPASAPAAAAAPAAKPAPQPAAPAPAPVKPAPAPAPVPKVAAPTPPPVPAPAPAKSAPAPAPAEPAIKETTPIPAPNLPRIEPVAAKAAPAASSAPQDQTQYFLNKDAAAVSEVLTVPLATISDAWPANILEEIASANLGDSSVAMPLSRVEAGLKVGKLSFTWKEVAGWLKPNPFVSQLNADTTVELPLKVIAPLFIAQHRPARPQKKVMVDESIPDVFAGGSAPGTAAAPVQEPKPAPAPSVIPKPPAAPAPSVSVPLPKPPASPVPAANLPKPPPAPIPAANLPKPPASPAPAPSAPIPAPSIPAPKAVMASEPKTLGELFGEPSRTDWSPKDIVQKTVGLKGISGAIVALQDGLMVAGELPAPFKAETAAAFLPQIFGRMVQYAKELNLGDMASLTVECNKAPLHITRAGLVYFGVLGKAGEELPAGQIKLIASELAKQNK